MSVVCSITYSRSQYLYTPYTHFLPSLYNQHYLPVPAPTFYNVPQIQTVKSTNNRNAITYNIPINPPTEYRGFGYRTDYNDGATSTVFYVTGPEAANLQNLKNFPLFKNSEETTTGRARSLASDITDTNAIPNPQVKIQNTLETTEFQKIFEKIMPGIISFYNYPAGTAPLNSVFPSINQTQTNPTETTTAASVTNTNIVDDINENTTNISTSTTTEKLNETESELSDSVVIEARDEKEDSTATTTTASA